MEPDTAQPVGQLKSEWLYQPNPGYYDEMLTADGSVRPHWRHLKEPLEQMGEAGFARRWQEGRRVIQENGTAYNVYSDPQSAGRPWPAGPAAVYSRQCGMGVDRGRHRTARYAAELDSGGSLRTTEIAERPFAAGAGISESSLPAALLQCAGSG
jgi:hypothetical protein